MESSQSAFSHTSLLLCKENLGSLGIEDEQSLLRCNHNLGSLGLEDEQVTVDAYDDEYIEMLLQSETTNGGLHTQELLQDSWIQSARLEGIHYILRKRELLGFGFQTAYVSVIYLDRFLSERSIEVEKSWAIRLLAMACLSLAAKMEENRVPPLLELCVEDYYFESSVIQRMELLVLTTLGWKMGAITPFDFIHFFTNKICDNSVPTNAVSTSVDVILGSIRDAKIMRHRASAIAAAATLVVLDPGLTREAIEIKIRHLNLNNSFSIESVISCYNLLKEMDIERLKFSKGIESPDLSPIQLQSFGSSAAASAKRKRLVFNQTDECVDEAGPKRKPEASTLERECK